MRMQVRAGVPSGLHHRAVPARVHSAAVAALAHSGCGGAGGSLHLLRGDPCPAQPTCLVAHPRALHALPVRACVVLSHGLITVMFAASLPNLRLVRS
jgi:hypothetical protein